MRPSMQHVFFVHNTAEVKFIHSSNQTEHYRKKTYYLTRTKHNCTSAKRIFNWKTLVTGHIERNVVSPQLKALPRSTANSTITSCSH